MKTYVKKERFIATLFRCGAGKLSFKCKYFWLCKAHTVITTQLSHSGEKTVVDNL